MHIAKVVTAAGLPMWVFRSRRAGRVGTGQLRIHRYKVGNHGGNVRNQGPELIASIEVKLAQEKIRGRAHDPPRIHVYTTSSRFYALPQGIPTIYHNILAVNATCSL